uniref:Receptor-like serine/threonine-protein kinase n=1 Tax=Hordeum vulgare subsp. vulgare TaxID=112509 RepID=A0A8I7B4T3_HORVV
MFQMCVMVVSLLIASGYVAAARQQHARMRGFVLPWMLVIANLWIICSSSVQEQVLLPGFSGSEEEYVDNNGIFLLSNGSVYGFGFVTSGVSESRSYLLTVLHLASTSVAWTANANSPVSHTDTFVFDKDGNAYLLSQGSTVWTANLSGKGASIRLLDSGNLIVLGKDGSSLVWQSFSYPTNTLLSGQSFTVGMTLDRRFIVNNDGGIYSANFSSTSWCFYDKSGSLLSEFLVVQDDAHGTLTVVLSNDGSLSFRVLVQTAYGTDPITAPTAIPEDSCDMPAQCSPYSVCISGTGCQCLSAFSTALSTFPNCNPGLISPCNSKADFQLAQVDSGVGYIGTRNGGGSHTVITFVIVVGPLAAIGVLVYVGFGIYRRRWKQPSPSQEQDDGFLQTISGAPTRFTYTELRGATNNFAHKLGQGGFGSVYLGTLPDGSSIAVKKLEGLGQGEKEFRSEMTTIGNIHHVHLVKLRGFCVEGSQRLLAYEYMPKGSLNRWIFSTTVDAPLLDWDTRFHIALGTAKGLAYLHQDCESKIIHCDIKPENVLLGDNFHAKVADFGLAKLMSREQSHVFTRLRGTRGYVAPEWITNYAISDKSNVYSYGIVLLEIISGRRSFDPLEASEKAHFPPFAFRKLEEGDLCNIVDAKLAYDDEDDRVEIAIRVALWCIQQDFSWRPSMSKVVQMLEGVCDVPQPPTSLHVVDRLHPNAFEPTDSLLSAVRLSSPR